VKRDVRSRHCTFVEASMHTRDDVLSDKLLHEFAERAAVYDRENRFFHEDFEDLKRAGYLTMPVPKELGGAGMALAEVCREQRRLASYAPATALGINMPLYWVGLPPISGARATTRSNGC